MAHVRRNPKGTYSALWREKDAATGKVSFRQKTFKQKRDAERFALNTEVALERGDAPPAPAKAPTIRALVAACLAASKARLRPSTHRGYEFTYNNHVLPDFGDLPITGLTPVLVEKWVEGLAAKGLSPATIRNTFVALSKVCKYAIRHGYIQQNPCFGTPLPRSTNPSDTFTGKVLTRSEVETLAASMAAPGGLLLRFMAYTGLRAGEVAGLKIEDFDPLHGTVRVRRTVQRIAGKGWVATAPKTKRSARTLPILSTALQSDMEHFLNEHPNRADPEAPLWPGRKPGTHAVDFSRRLDPTNFLRWYFRPALVAHDLPRDFRLHDLRHTAASLWLDAGIEPHKVSRWLGHSNIALTDSIYSHLYPSDYADERAAFDKQAARKLKTGPVRRMAR